MEKTAPKNSLYSKNGSILKMAKNGQNANVIAHAKYSVWVKEWNWPKHAKNVSTNKLKLFYGKKQFQKTAYIRKIRTFWKWPKMATMQRPCNLLSLGQKIKLPKTCEKRFYNTLQLFYAKKRLQKTANIRKMEAFWKWPKMATMQRL